MSHPSRVRFEAHLRQIDPTAARRAKTMSEIPEHACTQLILSNGWTVSMACVHTGSTNMLAFRSNDKTAQDIPNDAADGDSAAAFIDRIAKLPDTAK